MIFDFTANSKRSTYDKFAKDLKMKILETVFSAYVIMYQLRQAIVNTTWKSAWLKHCYIEIRVGFDMKDEILEMYLGSYMYHCDKPYEAWKKACTT